MKSSDSRIQAVQQAIDDSSIPEEMASCMMLATAMETVMNDVMCRIKAQYKAVGLDIKGNDVLKGMKNYCQAVKSAGYWFEREIEPRNIECTFGTFGTASSYDGFRARCGEVAEIVSMVCQASVDPEAMEEIRAVARRVACDRGITLEDWERLRLRQE